jgi:hypothetical protein
MIFISCMIYYVIYGFIFYYLFVKYETYKNTENVKGLTLYRRILTITNFKYFIKDKIYELCKATRDVKLCGKIIYPTK